MKYLYYNLQVLTLSTFATCTHVADTHFCRFSLRVNFNRTPFIPIAFTTTTAGPCTCTSIVFYARLDKRKYAVLDCSTISRTIIIIFIIIRPIPNRFRLTTVFIFIPCDNGNTVILQINTSMSFELHWIVLG